MISLDILKCSGDAETCPVVTKCFDYDAFAAITEQLDSNATDTRKMLGDFVTACSKGTCPGQHPEETKAVLRTLLGLQDPE